MSSETAGHSTRRQGSRRGGQGSMGLSVHSLLMLGAWNSRSSNEHCLNEGMHAWLDRWVHACMMGWMPAMMRSSSVYWLKAQKTLGLDSLGLHPGSAY